MKTIDKLRIFGVIIYIIHLTIQSAILLTMICE